MDAVLLARIQFALTSRVPFYFSANHYWSGVAARNS